MGKGLDIIPILYIAIPIFTGGAIGAVFNKYNILNRIYPIIAIVASSIIYQLIYQYLFP